MRTHVWLTLLLTLGLVTSFIAGPAEALEIVKDGKPVAVVVVKEKASSDAKAADVLVSWIKKISDAELQVTQQAPTDGPAIYIGQAAVEAGLKLDDIESRSSEGGRVLTEGRRVLIAGQNATATLKAVCSFLEELGCRYFLDHEMGEVYPRRKTVGVGKLDITQKPGFVYRRIWGSTWSGQNLWKVWNGAGGLPLSTGHSWGGYVGKEHFKEHPEWFPLGGDGKRRPSQWLCTSNPELRKQFAGNVLKAIKAGAKYPSISPPDGVSYCQCPTCRAQDDPHSVEPTSGTICVTNRFVDFFDFVGSYVAKEEPDALLNFYCYADYTQAPTRKKKLAPNLCAWIAPIRYCRYHAIANAACPSRMQLEEMIEDWSEVVSQIAYRTYTFNLAECSVPFSQISVWKHDIPYLNSQGCIGMNLESLHSWHIYGPHLYLAIRLSYDPDADADAVMDDYWLKMFGEEASVPMKAYWMEIDSAFKNMKCHTGCFFALHLVYTPERLEKLRGLLNEAAAAARGNEQYEQRVELFEHGYLNADEYIALREAMNTGDFAKAAKICDEMIGRNNKLVKQRLVNHYTPGYMRRFIEKIVDPGAAATAPPAKLLQVLPDRWRLDYDEEEQGIEKGYHKAGYDDSTWPKVQTYGNPLDAQGVPDRKTIMWYRTQFMVPGEHGRLALFFAEIDGNATVYVNGEETPVKGKWVFRGETTKDRRGRRRPVLDEYGKPKGKWEFVEAKPGTVRTKRTTFQVDVTDVVKPGINTVAVRVDHSRITELFLGGIIRPVLLIDRGK